jgi:nicotinate phosphoribosyltransferase
MANNTKDALKSTNSLVVPLLTDMYQITMAYAMWQNQRHELPAVFDLFFRKNPFKGEFTIFCGLEEVIRFVANYHFTDEHVAYVKESLPDVDDKFLEWLKGLDCSRVRIYALKEGSLCFPKVPLLRIEGPMGICQLLETTLLCLVNYPSLLATNAARHRLAAGPDKKLIEFGLRRAQGPDGGVSASRYTYIGGFDGTSNVLASMKFKIPAKGTHAHSWVESFTGFEDIKDRTIKDPTGKSHDFVKLVFDFSEKLGYNGVSKTELLSFAAYARTFPKAFVALVDTYDTLKSGVPNFLSVALALDHIGYKAIGLRLDSGDISYISKETRQMFIAAAEKFNKEYFKKLTIFASNELSEEIILSLNKQGHEVDVFAVGTNLVTCKSQPALGCVYKLVEVNNKPCIKLSNELGKVTLPGRKVGYRLYSAKGYPLADVLTLINDDNIDDKSALANAEKQGIVVGKKVFCQDPFETQKRVYITPSRVELLHHLVWDGKPCIDFPSMEEIKEFCRAQITHMREDHIRPLNPTPYKVSATQELHDVLHEMWNESLPIQELQ